jgi:hypothetical protein
MSDMAEDELGVPFTCDMPMGMTDTPTKVLKEQIESLEAMGVKVTGVHIVEPGSPPRFFITFVPGVPSFKVRTSLEREGWDVGQTMGDKMLKFYAAKRAVKSDGWTD